MRVGKVVGATNSNTKVPSTICRRLEKIKRMLNNSLKYPETPVDPATSCALCASETFEHTMVHYFTLLLTIFIVHLAWCYNEELLYPISDNTDNLYPEDETEDVDVHRRNSNFLRFGRTSPKMHEIEYDDYNENFARPTRSGKTEKNDYFIRFGRGSRDFLRFGRNTRRGDDHVRYGRSTEPENKRNKRETFSEFSDNKRGGSNFMRFGRNSNFLRFGRTHELSASNDPILKVNHLDGSLLQLLLQLIENLKKEQNKAQNGV